MAADGLRAYAIGDVHGCLDLLDDLLAQIRLDNADRSPAETLIVFLGDLIDRGPSSAGVIERALELDRGPENVRFLLGNHEEVFLKALHGDQKALSLFTKIGGRETILSYGLSDDEYRESDFAQLLAWLQKHVPQEHILFLERFEDFIEFGDYAFVHAGVKPGRSLGHQRPSDMRWIRHEFLAHTEPFEKVIVHGHSIFDDVERMPNRIGLDTGAFASGKLSAMGFEGDRVWVLQAKAQ